MWSWVADIALLIFLIFFGCLGWKRGFVVSVMKFISGFAAFVGAVLLLDVVCLTLQDWGMYEGMSDLIRLIMHTDQMQKGVSQSFAETGGIFGTFLQNIATVGGNLIFDTFVESIVSFIVNLLIFVILFCLLLIIFKLVTKLLNRMMSLPVLNFLNKGFGFLLGAAKAGVILYLVVGAIFIFVPVIKLIEVDQYIGSSWFFDWFIQNNHISELFHLQAF